jgi:hypothetical protein
MGVDLQLTGGIQRRQVRQILKARRRRANGGGHAKDGFAISRVVLFDESADEFLHFYRNLVTALGPRDAFEDLLVERVATSAWRLRRVCRIESGLFSKARASVQNGKLKRTRDIELVFLRLTSHDDTLAKLNRYEASLERSLLRAIQHLMSRQARRRGTATSDTADEGLEGGRAAHRLAMARPL